ncbi:SLATT domain-containing protein [Ramlibacter sp.]|uniref:SLATT domain-containing protein n=1 Tax=Ramlibacter sp. TaxID=1917967 RepID=UPI00263605DB|nr:SLATT domain-containing protein [Ramlibacter sp.]MDB5956840.1 hypothetical protein [Ramlibacter sp.]
MPQFDDIWFTYKARIAAEVRLRNDDLHSQVLLVWYAVLSTAGSIIAVRHEKFLGPDTDISLAILSVGLLAISMLVASRDFKGRALMMRANHLALKTLYDELKAGTVPATEKPSRYAKLLQECENHTSYDDRHFRVLNRTGLTSRMPSTSDYLLFGLHWSLRVAAFGVVYLLPLGLAFGWQK